MQTHIEPTDTSKAILASRQAQKLTMREFASALGVSHNAVNQWENGAAEPSQDRLQAWLNDSRDWVRELGVKIFAIKYGPMLANMAAGQPPIAPTDTAAKAA